MIIGSKFIQNMKMLKSVAVLTALGDRIFLAGVYYGRFHTRSYMYHRFNNEKPKFTRSTVFNDLVIAARVKLP